MKQMGVRRIISLMMTLLFFVGAVTVSAVERTEAYVTEVPNRIHMSLVGRYDVDQNESEGGLEIVTYNPDNQMAYAIDGENSVLIAVPMTNLAEGYQIDLSTMAESANEGFSYGDLTSVAVSPDHTKLAVALQADGYNDTGLIAVFPIDNSEDTLGGPVYYSVGVQPDMVIFADDSTLLSADEGEPRMGYGVNSAGVSVIDPVGSISIIDLDNAYVTIADFSAFDVVRDDLVSSGVLMTSGQAPSVDLEPEYIVVSDDATTAYVALQENNALAVVDLASKAITEVLPFGFKDYSAEGNEIYLDGSGATYENLLGAYMPDGISIYEMNDKTYILTANEGDGREWSSTVFPEDHEDAGDPNDEDTSYYSNETKITLMNGDEEVKKVLVLNDEVVDGLPADKNVMFGGRSFSIFEVGDSSLTLVYDSGSDFEDITSALYPDWFNTSNTKLKLNDRSTKKGPEPENVTVGMVGNSTYAFIALERIGGIMAYDITSLEDITYSNYINTRDFGAEDGIGGDSAPEGIKFIAAADSVTGNAQLIAGCEVTGTMPVYDLIAYPADMSGKVVIIHSNDTHGADLAVEGKSIGTAGVAQLVKDYEAAGAEVILISAGDTIQGAPLVNLSQGETAIDFMNLAEYDMMVPGNHEFDYAYDQLLALKSEADFPMITANILDKSTGEPAFQENIIFETEIGKVGVFGLTTPETQTKANPENVSNLTFLSGEAMYEVAREQVAELAAAGCEYIILTAHLGVDEGSEPDTTTSVIKHVEGIDVVIDGHSHTVLDGNMVGSAFLVSSGAYLENVGVIVMDENEIEAHLISAQDYSNVDTAINDVIASVEADIDAQLGEVFATTEVYLDGNRAPGVRTQETNLGDFAADAILWSANNAVGQGKVDAAITNGGGIRTSVEIGGITMKDMKTVFPFGNTISTIEMTGAQIIEVLEAATFSTPDSLGAFPHVAGITFTLNTAVEFVAGSQYPDSTYFAPANPGSRVTDVTIGGKDLDLDKTYTIATNNFLAAGGDTYYVFTQCANYNTYVALEDALVEYTQEVLGGVVTADMYGTTDGRINIINDSVVEVPVELPSTSTQDYTIYTVIPGDTLYKIAMSILGDGDRYTEIYDANSSTLTSPNWIYAGQELKVPTK